MRLPAVAALLLGLILCGQAVAAAPDVPAGTYVLDPTRSSLVAVTGYVGGLARVRLRFPAMRGRVAYDPATPRRSPVSLEVEAASVQSGQTGFDRLILRSLQAPEYPLIRFASPGLDLQQPGRAVLDGQLTLRGVTRPVSLEVTVTGYDPATGAIHFRGDGQIRRSDFGVHAPAPFARDQIELQFDVTFVGER